MAEKQLARRGRANPYTAAEIDRALIALSFSRGTHEAADLLKAEGIIAPLPDTIAKWRDQHMDRYLELCDSNAQKREKIITEELVPVIRKGVQVAYKALEKLDEKLDRDEVQDPAGAARNAATTSAIFIDKRAALEGKPTSIVKHLNGEEALRSLAKYGIRVVDGTAEEVDEGSA